MSKEKSHNHSTTHPPSIIHSKRAMTSIIPHITLDRAKGGISILKPPPENFTRNILKQERKR